MFILDAKIAIILQFQTKIVIFSQKQNRSSIISCTFAGVKLDNRRHITSWLLLAVFVPMLLLSSLHVHESGVGTAETECTDCVHNSCHGHLTQMASWTHDCVLCQFLSLTFVAFGVACLIIINKVVTLIIDAQRRNVSVAHVGIVGLRAPPAFSI